ncbi:MAG: NADAR family protein [Sandaracinaceae bacterium]|nr:NADAR family protein [Sandaracinaceae bacterium]
MDRRDLIARVEAGERPEYLFFWGHTPKPAQSPPEVGPWVLSNWFPSPFEIDGVRYATNEHWMMAEKARLFGDDDALAAVLAAETPAEAKAIGRAVRGYDDARWAAVRFERVALGCEAKFASRAALRAYLVGTRSLVLVEASPRDVVWGIGMGASHVDATDPRKWRGLNLLGFALMQARARLA